MRSRGEGRDDNFAVASFARRREREIRRPSEKAKACFEKTTDEIGKVFFVWLQGESDALAGTTEDDYLAMLRELIADLKKIWG